MGRAKRFERNHNRNLWRNLWRNLCQNLNALPRKRFTVQAFPASTVSQPNEHKWDSCPLLDSLPESNAEEAAARVIRVAVFLLRLPKSNSGIYNAGQSSMRFLKSFAHRLQQRDTQHRLCQQPHRAFLHSTQRPAATPRANPYPPRESSSPCFGIRFFPCCLRAAPGLPCLFHRPHPRPTHRAQTHSRSIALWPGMNWQHYRRGWMNWKAASRNWNTHCSMHTAPTPQRCPPNPSRSRPPNPRQSYLPYPQRQPKQ